MRKGTISDWRDLEPAWRAMFSGLITREHFAELGRRWLEGASKSEIEAELPESNTSRIIRLVKERPGLHSVEIDSILDLRPGTTAQMCGRLRKRGQVRTVVDMDHNMQIRVYPAKR